MVRELKNYTASVFCAGSPTDGKSGAARVFTSARENVVCPRTPGDRQPAWPRL